MAGYAQGFSSQGDDVLEELPRWRRMVPVALGTALALALVFLFVFAERIASDRDKALSLQQHSYEVILLARTVEASAARAETQLARYVVSLDATDGRRYSDAWRQTGAGIANLRRAVRDSAAQTANVRQLQAAYDVRGNVLNDIALRTTYDQRLGALSRLYRAGRSPSADHMTTILHQTIDQETDLLDQRTDNVDQSEIRAARLVGSYSLVGLVLLTAALFALWIANSAFTERHFVRRLADSESRRVDDLEAAVHARTLELEQANGRLRTEMEERAQAENSLRQLHKMEAVGQLTGGIAHDFNNMLAVVVGGLELARRRLGQDDDAVGRHIDNAMEGANRAASLTRRLLAFARAEPAMLGQVDPDALVQGMSELVDRSLGDQIQLEIDAQAADWRLWADRHQLENVLLNLCVNARDAMEGKGTLTISTAQARLASGQVTGCAAGDYVLLSVRDTGCGMTPEVVARVFEPFFTTKPVGKGTGLGLSQVFGYIGQLKGGIHIESAPGIGTDVRIYLPRSVAVADKGAASWCPTAANADDVAVPRTLLVVEDDPRVRVASISALEELGHRAISCDHPSKAADLLIAHPEIDLILTDVLMPDMTGPELIEQLRARGTSLPVIFVTGFGGDDAEAGLLDGENVLRKPFTLTKLDRMVAQVMAEHDLQPAVNGSLNDVA